MVLISSKPIDFTEKEYTTPNLEKKTTESKFPISSLWKQGQRPSSNNDRLPDKDSDYTFEKATSSSTEIIENLNDRLSVISNLNYIEQKFPPTNVTMTTDISRKLSVIEDDQSPSGSLVPLTNNERLPLFSSNRKSINIIDNHPLTFESEYQRRYRVERNTRTLLQSLFNYFETSWIFQWFKSFLMTRNNRQVAENSQSSPLIINRRMRRATNSLPYLSSHGYSPSYNNNYFDVDGYSNRNSYYGGPMSRQEAFIETLIDTWTKFDDVFLSYSSQLPTGIKENGRTSTDDDGRQQDLRNDEQERQISQEMVMKIDRYFNQGQYYFQRRNQFGNDGSELSSSRWNNRPLIVSILLNFLKIVSRFLGQLFTNYS